MQFSGIFGGRKVTLRDVGVVRLLLAKNFRHERRDLRVDERLDFLATKKKSVGSWIVSAARAAAGNRFAKQRQAVLPGLSRPRSQHRKVVYPKGLRRFFQIFGKRMRGR